MARRGRKTYRRKSRKASRSRRARKMSGGGAGIGGYSIGGPITPGAPIGNTAEVKPMESCLAVQRFGTIATPTTGLGLPGLSGGSRRSRRASRRTQRGGRYSFDLSASSEFGGTPWGSGIPQVQRIACEGSTPNPLNPGPHTPSTAPPLRGGGGLGIDKLAYYAPTAGYSNTPSSWVGSTGAPSLLQTPYEARAWNQACLKTGGGRKRRRAAATKRHRRRRA
jgi:hypothetical protein